MGIELEALSIVLDVVEKVAHDVYLVTGLIVWVCIYAFVFITLVDWIFRGLLSPSKYEPWWRTMYPFSVPSRAKK